MGESVCRRKHTGRRGIGASQWRGDRPALRAAAPTQRGLRTLQPSARTSRREGKLLRNSLITKDDETLAQLAEKIAVQCMAALLETAFADRSPAEKAVLKRIRPSLGTTKATPLDVDEFLLYLQQSCSLHFRPQHCGPFMAVQVVLDISDISSTDF